MQKMIEEIRNLSDEQVDNMERLGLLDRDMYAFLKAKGMGSAGLHSSTLTKLVQALRNRLTPVEFMTLNKLMNGSEDVHFLYDVAGEVDKVANQLDTF